MTQPNTNYVSNRSWRPRKRRYLSISPYFEHFVEALEENPPSPVSSEPDEPPTNTLTNTTLSIMHNTEVEPKFPNKRPTKYTRRKPIPEMEDAPVTSQKWVSSSGSLRARTARHFVIYSRSMRGKNITKDKCSGDTTSTGSGDRKHSLDLIQELTEDVCENSQGHENTEININTDMLTNGHIVEIPFSTCSNSYGSLSDLGITSSRSGDRHSLEGSAIHTSRDHPSNPVQLISDVLELNQIVSQITVDSNEPTHFSTGKQNVHNAVENKRPDKYECIKETCSVLPQSSGQNVPSKTANGFKGVQVATNYGKNKHDQYYYTTKHVSSLHLGSVGRQLTATLTHHHSTICYEYAVILYVIYVQWMLEINSILCPSIFFLLSLPLTLFLPSSRPLSPRFPSSPSFMHV